MNMTKFSIYLLETFESWDSVFILSHEKFKFSNILLDCSLFQKDIFLFLSMDIIFKSLYATIYKYKYL